MGTQKTETSFDIGHLRDGLQLLLIAHEYAMDSQRTAWDFAVEFERLDRKGVTICDLRWLICKGLLSHQAEIIVPGTAGRTFSPTCELSFNEQSCFVLTQSGVDFCRDMLVDTNELKSAHAARPVDACSTPHWNADLREFRVNGQLVKRYRLPSPNQETVLTAFEEEAWAVRILDPLPPTPNVDPKRRLHDTINSLNRNQKSPLVRFEGDGTGEGIRWRAVFE